MLQRHLAEPPVSCPGDHPIQQQLSQEPGGATSTVTTPTSPTTMKPTRRTGITTAAASSSALTASEAVAPGHRAQSGLEKPRRRQKTGEPTQGEDGTHGQPRVVMPLQVGAEPPEHALPGLISLCLGDRCRAQIDLPGRFTLASRSEAVATPRNTAPLSQA
jgi:hypothetical protein